METSLNGWPAFKDARDPNLKGIMIPGTHHTIHAARYVHVVFAAYLADWNRLMPARLKLNDKQMVAAWNYRQARSGTGLSNHSSGTAVDVCWNTVLLPDNKPHMTDKERAILKTILGWYVTADGHHILSNGEHWKRSDGMHTEISQGWDKEAGAKRNTTQKDVLEVINRLRINSEGNRPLG
jgi:hypothetical protein